MDLQQFMANYGSRSAGADLTNVGPASSSVFARLNNEGRTRSTIATFFWRSFLSSRLYPYMLRKLGASPKALAEARVVLVPRDQDYRYDLLVFDPGWSSARKPEAIAVGPNLLMPTDLDPGAHKAARQGVPLAIGVDYLDVVREVVRSAPDPFTLVLAPQPSSELLSCPSPAVHVDDLAGQDSTAGVIVECQQSAGTYGVTAALHGIAGPSAVVHVDGQQGTVQRIDAVTDAAFISLPTKPNHPVTTCQGIMSGVLPRGQEGASFEGQTSGQRSTVICGWDPQLPNPSRHRQGLIYTRRDSQPGDSGAALVTSDGWIVGFAFERSLPNEVPAQCSWIWAASAMAALNVKLA